MQKSKNERQCEGCIDDGPWTEAADAANGYLEVPAAAPQSGLQRSDSVESTCSGFGADEDAGLYDAYGEVTSLDASPKVVTAQHSFEPQEAGKLRFKKVGFFARKPGACSATRTRDRVFSCKLSS